MKPPAETTARTASTDSPAAAWTVEEPLEVSKALLRQVATFGHLVDRFLAARQVFLKRAVKPGQFDEFKPWLKGFSAETSPCLEGDGCFASVFELRDERLVSHTLASDPASAEWLLQLWQRLDGSEAPPALLPACADANAALWPALIRLRPLREFWERELGRSPWESLCQLLPDAWVLEPTVLPHGAVIPRLEIAGWEELQDLLSERGFFISTARKAAREGSLASEEHLQEALEASAQQVSVLTEAPDRQPDLLVGIYVRKGKRTDMLGAFSVQEPLSIRKIIQG